ncbi:MAG: Spy/CpxP family protein refolding chaperone [Leptospiraceae bacterium]|nr:Spy/CpxP family protein refolding chaperone [Leptospiraceae bacterium]
MNKLTKLISILSITNLIACGGWHKSPEDKAKWIVKKISSELDLTDKQKSSLEKMKEEYLAKRKELKFGMSKETQAEILAQVKSSKPDEKKLDSIFDEEKKKREQMFTFLQKKFYEFHSTLTQEQKNTLAEKMEKIFKRHFHEF